LALQAAGRDVCQFDFLWGQIDYELVRKFTYLVELARLDGDRLTAAGELDAAWRRYTSALTMIDQMRWRTGWVTLFWTTYGETMVLESMAHWSAADGQTQQRVEDALAQFQIIRSGPPPWKDAMHDDYAVKRNMVDEALNDAWRDGRAKYIMFFVEFARWKRLQDFFLRDTIRSWDGYMDDWAAERSTLGALTHAGDNWPNVHHRHLLEEENREFHSVMVGTFVPNGSFTSVRRLEVSRRATIIRLACAAYRLQKGQWPESLDELAPRFLSRVPGVAGLGRSFTYYPQGWPMELVDPMLRPIPAGTPVLYDGASLPYFDPAGGPAVAEPLRSFLQSTADAQRQPAFFPLP
jgi:hypothetical protein